MKEKANALQNASELSELNDALKVAEERFS